MRRRSTPCTAAFNASGVASSRYGISSRCTKVSYRIGESLCRCSCALDRAIANCVPRTSKRSEEHTSELQSLTNLVCRLLLEKKKKKIQRRITHLSREKKPLRQKTAYSIRETTR